MIILHEYPLSIIYQIDFYYLCDNNSTSVSTSQWRKRYSKYHWGQFWTLKIFILR